MKNKIDFVKIDYKKIPKELFEKYGVKPFKIMKYKMRDKDGNVWNKINYFDAIKECKKLGYRLPNTREMLMLLEVYTTKNKQVGINDKEFLGIEELGYDENVYREWIYFTNDIAFGRGGTWNGGYYAEAFALSLDRSPAGVSAYIGFRCVKDN